MIKNAHTLSELERLLARARMDAQVPTEWRLARDVFDGLVESTPTRWAVKLFDIPIDVIPNNSRSFLLCEGGFKYILVEHIDMRGQGSE